MAKWNEKSFYCLDGNVLLIEVMQHTLNPLSPEYKQKVAGFPFLFHVRPQKKCLFYYFVSFSQTSYMLVCSIAWDVFSLLLMMY